MANPDRQDTIEKIEIGGLLQTLAIAGNPEKPALIILHGGGLPLPGVSSQDRYPLLAENFLLVFWDQRGTGASATAKLTPDSMQLEHYLSDVQEITDYVRKKYHKEKIFLLGHSWGAMLGLLTIKRFPEKYFAYIGVSQQIDVKKSDALVYSELRKSATDKGSKSQMKLLDSIGEPPYSNVEDWLKLRELVARNGGLVSGKGEIGLPGFLFRLFGSFLFNSNYGASEVFRFQSRMNTTLEYTYQAIVDYDESELNNTDLPVLFIHGQYDRNSHPRAIQSWFSNLEAPSKEFVVFGKSGHMPMWEEPQRFQLEVINFSNDVLSNASAPTL